MQARVKRQPDGIILLRMDAEAARATFASIVFASRYHDGICDLEAIAKKALEETKPECRRKATCR
jgi:hypothetical protein